MILLSSRLRGWLIVAMLGASCVLLCACVVIRKKDAFPVPGKLLSLSALQTLADRDGKVQSLRVSAGGRPVTAYYLRHPNARGVLIFFGGSGNQVDAAIKGLGARTASFGLDLVVFAYYQQGEEIPSVAQARAEAKAVYTAVEAMHPPAAKSVYLLGHSLGGWFALDVASSENVRGLVLAGAETTPAEDIRATDFPWANLVVIRPDADTRALDASLYAPHLQTPTLVVTSRQDEAVPAAIGQKIFGMIPATTPKRFVALEGVTHGRYFLSDAFWRQFADFFRLPSTSNHPTPD